MKEEIIFIVKRSEDGTITTSMKTFDGLDTILVGVALASCTRVAAKIFCNVLKLKESHCEQIEAQIAEIYNRELQDASGDVKITTEK